MADGDVAEKVATADGRALTYLEVGDPTGPLVIHNHGGPTSRLEARLLAEWFAQGSDGLVCDAELLYRSWAFGVATTERPVRFIEVGAGDDVFAIAAEELGAA